MSRGLTRRMMFASGLLALLVGAAFAVLLRAIDSHQAAGRQALASQNVLATAATVERLVLDLEAAQRGYLIAGDERLLRPWTAAQRSLLGASWTLVRRSASVPAQERRAQAIVRSVDSYVRDYSRPVVAAARRNLATARRERVLDAGRRRIDALRGRFEPFLRAQRDLFTAAEARADADAHRAVVVTIAGLAGSGLVIALFLGLERGFETLGSSLEQSRDELRALAEEQAALRRVATLVARAVPPPELFEAVASEVRYLLGADSTRLIRCPPDPSVNGAVAVVIESGRAARVRSGEGSEVGAPIVVEGRLWGVMLARFERAAGLVAGTEERMAQFTELVATAIANANSRAELAASRARVVAAADEARRRIERDLHDGAQQSLTHTVIALKFARRSLAGAPATVLVDEALDHAERATEELRELAHGILPGVLSRGGLQAGLESLVGRLKLPVSVAVTDERFPEPVEATAYFIAAEALTNVIKHAGADSAEIRAFVDGDVLRLEVADDGVGGARLDGGSGLLGLSDRAAALDGRLAVRSRPGTGTVVTALLPIRA